MFKKRLFSPIAVSSSLGARFVPGNSDVGDPRSGTGPPTGWVSLRVKDRMGPGWSPLVGGGRWTSDTDHFSIELGSQGLEQHFFLGDIKM